jgi:uncharacterized membrane protein YidH (DUF202 family)
MNRESEDKGHESGDPDAVVLSEVQLLLAEERTSLAVMRTGIAVLVLPLSVFSVLVATSRYYDPFNVLHFLVPLGLLCVALLVVGGYLVVKSILRLRRIDRLVHRIKLEHSGIARFLDPAD